MLLQFAALFISFVSIVRLATRVEFGDGQVRDRIPRTPCLPSFAASAARRPTNDYGPWQADCAQLHCPSRLGCWGPAEVGLMVLVSLIAIPRMVSSSLAGVAQAAEEDWQIGKRHRDT